MVHRLLSRCGAQAPEYAGSVVTMRELSCPTACEILVPRPGIEPMSPALEGGFLTTGPPGESQEKFLQYKKRIRTKTCKCKEFSQFGNKKTTHRKVDKRYKWTIHRRANTNDKKTYKQMLIFPAVREMRIQVQCCHLYLSNWQELKRVILPTADSDIERKDSHGGGNMNLVDFLKAIWKHLLEFKMLCKQQGPTV